MRDIMICANIAGAGKDTVADYLVLKYEYTKISFAQPIYEIAKEFFSMEKKDRELLQNIGQKMREIDPDVWVNNGYKRAREINTPVVITDVRQINEFHRGIEEDFMPVRIVCDRNIAIRRIIERDGVCDESKLDGPAEDGTRDLLVPQIYNNTTYENLYSQIDGFIKNIKYK